MRSVCSFTQATESNSVLAFNLDFYTEVQDLSHLENLLNQSAPRFSALNMAICSLIEDYSLVGFETLAVEVSEFSTCLRSSLTVSKRISTLCYI